VAFQKARAIKSIMRSPIALEKDEKKSVDKK